MVYEGTVWNDTTGVIVQNNAIILNSKDWNGARARMDNVTFTKGDEVNFILNISKVESAGVAYLQLSDKNTLGESNDSAFEMYMAFPDKRIDFRTYGNDTGASATYDDGDNLAFRIDADYNVDVLKNNSPIYRYPSLYKAKPNTNYYQQIVGVGKGQTHQIDGLYKKTSSITAPEPESIPVGFHKMPDGSIMKDTDMYIVESDGLVRMVRLGAVEYTEIRIPPSEVQDLIDRGVGRLLTEAERAPSPVFNQETQIILNKFENNDYTYPTWFESNIVLLKNGSISSSRFLNSLENLLQTGVIIDNTIQPVITEPEPEPKKYDVNTYRLNEFGGVFNQIEYGIDGVKLQELESKYRVTLVGSPTPSDQEIFDFYNYVDTSTNETMVSQSIGSFSLENGKVKGKILYIAESSFNSYYYNKTLFSIVQIKDQSDRVIKLKVNNLNFTETQRDETINIDEGVGNEISAVKIEFTVSKNPDGTQPLSLIKVEEEVAKEVNLPPCPIGQHRDFNGECVNDGGKDINGSTSLLGKVMGITALLGTLALLGSKRR
tara:strand:+ start:2998 stop:4635 length:1638 start_codon:yes stop_codon:yes gene_type:complete